MTFAFKIDIRGVDKLSGPLGNASRRLTAFGEKAKRTGKKLTFGLTAPAVGAGISIFRTAASFERSMNRVEALTGAVGDEFTALEDQAKDLGKTTQFTASQVAEGMGFLAMAGFDVNQVLGAMPGTLQLAAAAQMELGESADIVSNVLTGYRMEVGELNRVNDVLVGAFTSSNTDLRQLGEAMKLAGPVAAGMNIEFEQTVAALGLMGSAGFQASLAGTALRGALARLAKPTGEAKKVLTDLGIDKDRIVDSEGNVRDLIEVVRALEESGAGADEMLAIFGQRAGPAMTALVGQGSEALETFVVKLRDVEGVSAKIAESQMKGAAGDLARFVSAMEGLKISIAESGFLEAVTDIIVGFTDWAARMSESDPELLKMTTGIVAFGAALGPVIFSVGLLVTGIGALISPIGLAVAAIAGLAVAGAKLAGGWEALGDRFVAVWEFIKGGFVAMADGIAGVFTGIWNGIKATWNAGVDWVGRQVDRLVGILPKWAQKALGADGDVTVRVEEASTTSPAAAAVAFGGASPGSAPAPARVDVRFGNVPDNVQVDASGETLSSVDVGYSMEGDGA